MKLLDLFAGIGGFSLAAHWMGWETVGFVEWDKYNQKVLAKNFPNTPIHGDITTYHGTLHEADIITGGFPCQPFSNAGKREGTNDSRYLWPEMLRVIREVQPAYVIGENVAGIYSMDNGSVFEQVCVDLENEDYSVQPFCIPACATGAPHRRDRWWFVAYSEEAERKQSGRARARRQGFANDNILTADTQQAGLEGWLQSGNDLSKISNGETGAHGSFRHAPSVYGEGEWPEVAARLCRVDDGLPAWVDRHRTNRLKSLGNTIQPQVAHELLKAINAIRF